MVSTVSHLNSRYFLNLKRQSFWYFAVRNVKSHPSNTELSDETFDGFDKLLPKPIMSTEVCWFWRAAGQGYRLLNRSVLISTCSESYTESSRETCAKKLSELPKMFSEHVLKHIWENERFFRNTHVLQLFEIFLYSFSLNNVVN